MLETAVYVEDINTQGDLINLKVTDVIVESISPVNLNDSHFLRNLKLYRFAAPNHVMKVLEKVEFKKVSVCISILVKTKFGLKTNEFYGTIEKIIKEKVYFKTWYDSKTKNFVCSSIFLEFNRYTIKACLNALLSADKLLSSYLSDFEIEPHNQLEEEQNFLINGFKEKDFVWIDPRLKANKEQQTAIMNIVNCTAFPFPYVIFGPPGKKS